MKRYLPAIAAALLLCPLPAQAQEAPAGAEDDEAAMICVAAARRWGGSASERARILQDPIPASFKRQLDTTGCARWQFVEQSLIDWHLRYGDASSTRAAIRFLEPHLSTPLDPRLAREFIAAWTAAVDDLRAVVRETPPADVARHLAVNGEAIRARRPIARLIELRNRLTGYDAVAHEYTRAAEFFLTPELVDDARPFQAPTYAVATFIEQQRAVGEIEAWLAETAGTQRYGERMSPASRELSLAVTAAAIAPTRAAIEAAGALTGTRYSPDGGRYPIPDLETFLHRAYEDDGDEACTPDERNSRPGYEERCEDSNFEIDALDYWYDRSRLELVAQRAGIALAPLAPHYGRGGVTERTIDLFMRREWSDGLRYGERRTGPEVVRLLVFEADALAFGPAPCGAQPGSGDAPVLDAFERLLWAETLVHPARDPRLYRRVAEAYVGSYDAARRCGERIDTDYERGALVSRAILAEYDRLIAAE